MNCPHCGEHAFIRSSRELSTLSRENRYQCSNVWCGHTFVGIVEIVRTLSPAARPNPAVRLPISTEGPLPPDTDDLFSPRPDG